MSVLGQKQTCAAHKPMSALPPEADIAGYSHPLAEFFDVPIERAQIYFKHFGGVGMQSYWHL